MVVEHLRESTAVLDNLFTGSKENLAHWMGHPNFELVRHDVVDAFMIECDQIYVGCFFLKLDRAYRTTALGLPCLTTSIPVQSHQGKPNTYEPNRNNAHNCNRRSRSTLEECVSSNQVPYKTDFLRRP